MSPSAPVFPAQAHPAPHFRLAYTGEDSQFTSRSSIPTPTTGAEPRANGRFSHSRGRPRMAVGESGVGTVRERSESGSRACEFGGGIVGSEWDPAERGRSLSNGRDGSRVPFFRLDAGAGRKGADRSESRAREKEGPETRGEQKNGGEKRMERNGSGSETSTEKEGLTRCLLRLGRHFIGVRGERAFPTPLFRPLERLPLTLETPLLTFLGVFVSILICAAVSSGLSRISGEAWSDTPLTFGSLGASAVLLYALPEAPLSQPRNLWGGHMICALVGCIISQLFSLSPRFTQSLSVAGADNEVASLSSWRSLTPVAGALAVALATLGMQLTGTVHPPGGATALIAAYHLRSGPRWTYLLDVFLSISGMGLWAMLVNNLGRRRYPAYWWSSPPPNPPALSPTAASSPKNNKHIPAQHLEHSHSRHSDTSPTDVPALTPEEDLQQRWLGRLGEVDEEALAGGQYDAEDSKVRREEARKAEEERERQEREEEERGRRARRRTS